MTLGRPVRGIALEDDTKVRKIFETAKCFVNYFQNIFDKARQHNVQTFSLSHFLNYDKSIFQFYEAEILLIIYYI